MNFIYSLVFFCLFVNYSFASESFGIDISVPLSTSSAACLKSAGVSFIIPRGYRSIGEVDLNVCNSLITAADAGIQTRDVYIFPCPTCSKTPDYQMGELVSYLNANCKSYWSGRVWLDIEGPEYWLGNFSDNQIFYKQLVESCSTYGVTCAVYSSASQWNGIFGPDGFTYGNDMLLWFAHYDGQLTLTDFVPFGGWTTPYAKQYAGDTSQCSMAVDLDWAPTEF